jgi:hypothetical protein
MAPRNVIDDWSASGANPDARIASEETQFRLPAFAGKIHRVGNYRETLMIRRKITFALLYFAAACAWAGNPAVQPVQGLSEQAHPYRPPSRYSYAPATRALAPVRAMLTVTVPSSNPYVSTNPSLVITGTCTGVTEVNRAATGQTPYTDNKSVACIGGKYAFPLLYKTKPDTYTYAVFANDAHGNPVGRFDITWIHGQAPVGIQPR